MVSLDFPKYPLRIKSSKNKPLVFDPVRKKYVTLTPEEWVRQHCLQFLIHDRNYPAGRMLVERQIRVAGLEKRVDIGVCHPDGSLHVLVECKAPEIAIDQQVFDQIARYNWEVRADLLMVTNGLRHYYCQMDYQKKRYAFLEDLPPYGSG